MKQMLSSLDDLDTPVKRKSILIVSMTHSNYVLSWANMFSSLADVSLQGPYQDDTLVKPAVTLVSDASDASFDALIYHGPLQLPEKYDKSKMVYLWPFNEEPDILTNLDSDRPHVSSLIENIRKQGKPREVWVVPQSAYCVSLIDRMYEDVRIRTVPQLWTPRYDFKYETESKDSSKGIDIAILSDMCSDSNTLMYSLLACEALVKKIPEYVNSIIILRDKQLSQGTIDLIKTFGLESITKTVLAKEEAIVPFFHKRPTMTYFLYHQNDHTERPDLLWDLMWCGIPLIHNVKTGLDVGLKYSENNVLDMIKLLQVNKKHLDDSFCMKSRANLEKLSNGQGKALDFLLSLDVK
jgi:hypothetical protein